MSDYLKGYKKGLKTYCTSEKAKELGKGGFEIHKACENINKHFSSHYKVARKGFLATKLEEEILSSFQKCNFSSDCDDKNKQCIPETRKTELRVVVTLKVCK